MTVANPHRHRSFCFYILPLGLMAIGAGGIRSSSLAFGADQLGKRDKLQRAGILESFFSWYYATVSVAVFLAHDLQRLRQAGWMDLLEFWRHPLDKRSIKLSSQVTDDVYHHRKGSKLVVPTEKLRFLNKACVIRNPEEDLISDGRASNPWSLCTVDEVEELKSLIKVIPIWSTGVLMSINVLQHSFIVFQASTMDRHITSKFQVPAASFTAFQLFSSVIWIALYDRVVIPLASKIRGKPTRLSLKQRIGIGILSSSAAMAALAIIETARRETAIKDGFSDDPDAVLPISAMWLLLYFFITGFAEAFCGIGQNEFFYTELPKTMSSVASNLFEMGLSVSNLVASLLVMIVRNFFKTKDQESWLSSNINKGHYDYYYWLLAGLSLVNFIYYRTCSKAYGPCKGQGGNATDEGEALTDEDS
ncbi:PROTEIN NRT1/ PTR FAMILY 1.3 [Salix purpurea]|uniref:PROTEIN NRT1/ PTR FAMILY 1.3 n=1 Tax=Salix purpurea TaxID=77065 RepID=A0A9Q0ZFH3_SALPP|nr:PROTEIN NRT1/ PTR FAMILY 1.3 [Salix purpurea]